MANYTDTKKKVRVIQYKWEGSWGPFRIAVPCGECSANEGITQDVVEVEFAGEPVSFEVRPWLNNWWRVLPLGGFHAPITLVNGKLVSQGAVIDRGLLAYRIRNELVKGYKIPAGANVVFTKPGCQFCARAKELLAQKGIIFEERNIVQNALFARQLFQLAKRVIPHGMPITTPQIWLDGRYVGGFTELNVLVRE